MIVDQASEHDLRAFNEVLHGLRLVDSCYWRTELSAPWGLSVAACPAVTFHFVAEGPCWLQSAEGVRRLQVGELVVFPRGSPHRLLESPDVVNRWILDLPVAQPREPVNRLTHGGGGERSLVICGGARFDPPDQPLVDLLPQLLAVDTDTDENWTEATLRLMGLEVATRRPGGETVLGRLCDLLVIHALRKWLAIDPAHAGAGWARCATHTSARRSFTCTPTRPTHTP